MAKTVSMAAVFDKVGYKPHSGQGLFHAAKALHRFRVMCAGRRTGKSTGGGHELTVHAFDAYNKQKGLDKHGKRHEYWIVGPEYSDSEKEFRVVYNDLKQRGFQFDKPGTYYDAIGGNMHISLFDGKFQIHGKSAKYPETLVGEGLKGVILAEAAKLKGSVWPKFIRPMLIDSHGWAILTSTPEGKNWFYDEWMRGMTDDPEWWSIRLPSYTNDILFPMGKQDPEFLSLIHGLSEEVFKQEILAEFTEFVGRVFKRFDEEVHCMPLKFNPAFETYAAVDYGWTNPFVWLLIQVDHWDNVYVIGEYYERHRRIEEISDELLARGLVPRDLRAFYPDPASPGDTAQLEKDLRIPSRGNTGGEVTERLNLIRKWLEIPKSLEHLPYSHPERKPKLFVDPQQCPNFVREFNDYRYPDTNDRRDPNELPMKKDDHTPEALGRFMRGHFGEQEKPQRSRVRKSTLSGSRR